MDSEQKHKLSLAGLIISIGIVFGDIGTSPLYVVKAIIGTSVIDQGIVFGGISCVFWVLTLQTTVKYIWVTLNADNRGEGGIFALYFLVRKKSKYFIIPTVIGACALLSDGLITPPISITSAIEGLTINYPDFPVVPVVLVILSVLFLVQQFGTSVIGKAFGPIMVIWFLMLAVLGTVQIAHYPVVLEAINPYYGIKLLFDHPQGILLLGAVFLCTTGAEALYSDLGHCGRRNIRVSWIFVKVCLLLNYFGQGAWVLSNKSGQFLEGLNPFYAIVPEPMLLVATFIAASAAIIASQALITGTFTLIAEATKLNLWPKVKIRYPSDSRGQIYVPFANAFLWIGCVVVVLIFRKSESMEAAYGLTITIDMLMTTILVTAFLKIKRYPNSLAYSFALIFFIIEIFFLFGTGVKFLHGGWFTVFVGLLFFVVMWCFYRAGRIKKRYVKMVEIKDHLGMIKDLSEDEKVPKYCSHLAYLTNSNFANELEFKILYSILQKQPKRADTYWVIHVNVCEDPKVKEYSITEYIPHKFYRVDFHLGFKVAQRVNLLFRKVINDMVAKGEIDITSTYPSLRKHSVAGDFRFIVLHKVLSNGHLLRLYDRIVMGIFLALDKFSIPVQRSFGLDLANMVVENIPLITVFDDHEDDLEEVEEPPKDIS